MGQIFSYPSLTARKDISIYMHGYWASGKTSLLKSLEIAAEDTEGIPSAFMKSATIKNIKVLSWSLGGRVFLRALARPFYEKGVDAMLILVDSSTEIFDSRARDLVRDLTEEEALKDTIFLVMATKQDLPEARSVEEMRGMLEFDKVTGSHVAHFIGCSVETGEGIQEALDWLGRNLAAKGDRTSVETREKEAEGNTGSLVSRVKDGFQALESYLKSG